MSKISEAFTAYLTDQHRELYGPAGMKEMEALPDAEKAEIMEIASLRQARRHGVRSENMPPARPPTNTPPSSR